MPSRQIYSFTDSSQAAPQWHSSQEMKKEETIPVLSSPGSRDQGSSTAPRRKPKQRGSQCPLCLRSQLQGPGTAALFRSPWGYTQSQTPPPQGGQLGRSLWPHALCSCPLRAGHGWRAERQRALHTSPPQLATQEEAYLMAQVPVSGQNQHVNSRWRRLKHRWTRHGCHPPFHGWEGRKNKRDSLSQSARTAWKATHQPRSFPAGPSQSSISIPSFASTDTLMPRSLGRGQKKDGCHCSHCLPAPGSLWVMVEMFPNCEDKHWVSGLLIISRALSKQRSPALHLATSCTCWSIPINSVGPEAAGRQGGQPRVPLRPTCSSRGRSCVLRGRLWSWP